MEVKFAVVISIIQPLIIVLMTGRATLPFNIKFWPWLLVGLFAPFIGVVITLCGRVRNNEIQDSLPKPVSSEEIFDPLLQTEEPKRIYRDMIQFLARV